MTLQHGQQTTANRGTQNLATGTAFDLTTSFAQYRTYFTTFVDVYTADKWAQHGISLVSMDTGSMTLADIWSLYCYIVPKRRVWSGGPVVSIV